MKKYINIKLSAEELVENFKKLRKLISIFSIERQELLNKFMDDFEEKFLICPAASRTHHHGAFPGGLVVHTLNVCKNFHILYDMRKNQGENMNGYTLESGLFCALVHDFGKLGTLEHDYYVPSTSDWHMKNQGKIYDLNPAIDFMPHEHRSIYLLQKYGIKLTQIEWTSIITHAGMFDEANKRYWMPYQQADIFKTNLPYILHDADMLSYRQELDSEKIINPNKIETI